MKLLAGLLGLVISLGAQVQPAPGEFNYRFTNGMLPIHDISISAVTNVAGIDELFTLNLSPKGRFSGSFAAHYDDGIVVVDVNGLLTGSLAYTPPVYRIVFAGHGPLSGTAYGRPIHGSHVFRARLEADLPTGIATGSETVTVCLAGFGCRTSSEVVTFDILEPASSGGDWLLTLSLTNRGRIISGSAQATLANARTVEFRVRGTYSPRTQITRLTLRGTDLANGVLINLTANSAMHLQTVRGKLFGQRLDRTFDGSP